MTRPAPKFNNLPLSTSLPSNFAQHLLQALAIMLVLTKSAEPPQDLISLPNVEKLVGRVLDGAVARCACCYKRCAAHRAGIVATAATTGHFQRLAMI